ncbi:cytochrome P450 monooxygenase pc-3 [Infundibulicybe gibba]|nr:cytochrome P450 monooxygenase pc-3 [Infundibulicybe gibba]
MELPPGPRYLLQNSPRYLATSFLAFISLHTLTDFFSISLPRSILILASFCARPGATLTRRYYQSFRDKRNAARLGVEIAPMAYDPWPAGIGLISTMINSQKYGHPVDVMHTLTRQYGNSVRVKMLAQTRIITVEPHHIKAILANQFENFEKGPVSFSQFHSLLGTGVFNSDDDMWKFHRSMTRPFFTKDRITDFDNFERHADSALLQARARLAEGYAIDFQDLVSRFTLDSATEFLFGTDVCSLSAGLPYPETASDKNLPSHLNHPSHPFVQSLMAGQTKLAARFGFGLDWPLFEFWGDSIKPHRAVIDGFVGPLLAKAIERKERIKEGDEVNLLDHLLKHTDDEQILKDELVNLLVAGRDTTASTLTFATYMLSEHPHIVDKLRAEILGVVGKTQRPTYDDIREMKYLRAFINETLRLYPPVPADARTSKESTVLPSPTPRQRPLYVPADTEILYSVMLMHRRKDLWGPDALTFDPDRFIDSRLGKYLTPNPFIFLPFNAGPRICLGQQFAYHEVSFFLVRLLQQFSRFSLARDAQPESSINERPRSDGTYEKVWAGSHLTMFARGGMWVRMQEAQDT